MKLLILSGKWDMHAVAVEWALSRRSVECLYWSALEYPRHRRTSVRIADGCARVSEPGTADLGVASTVWLRRLGSPMLPPDLHPADERFAGQEARRFLDEIVRMASPQARWLNPPDSAARVRSKAFQLLEASKAGLHVPETLISNDPTEIRAFAASCGGRVVAKSYLQQHWVVEGRKVYTMASQPSPELLADDASLAACPTIFQQRLDARGEYRVMVIGDRLFPTRMVADRLESSLLDWKAFPGSTRWVACDLPEAVADAIRLFMKRTGLCMGCIDLIETVDGTFCFLEVNQQGQFLWQEQFEPGIGLLEGFADFVANGHLDAGWRPKGDITFSAFEESSLHADVEAQLAVQEFPPEYNNSNVE